MKRVLCSTAVAFGVSALLAAPALAQGGFASAKTAARVADFVLVDNVLTEADAQNPSTDVDTGWNEIFNVDIKSSNDKYIYIEPSLECILVTQTHVKNRNHGKQTTDSTAPDYIQSDTSTAESIVQVRVLVDGNNAYPHGIEELDENGDPLFYTGITYCSRTQEVEALFGGIFTDCEDTLGAVDVDGNPIGDGLINVLDECQLTDEELRMLLASTTATSFNFIYGPMDADVHNVSVEARIVLSADAQAGSALAEAGIGYGTVVVSEGRLSHSQGDVLCPTGC